MNTNSLNLGGDLRQAPAGSRCELRSRPAHQSGDRNRRFAQPDRRRDRQDRGRRAGDRPQHRRGDHRQRRHIAGHAATLKLVTASTVAETGAGSLVVANLAVVGPNGVTLDSAANNVSALAGSTAADADFRYRDATGFVIDTVDGVVGLDCTDLADLIDVMTLTAGGAVSQTAGPTSRLAFSSSRRRLLHAEQRRQRRGDSRRQPHCGDHRNAQFHRPDALNIGAAGGTTGITTNDSNAPRALPARSRARPPARACRVPPPRRNDRDGSRHQ